MRHMMQSGRVIHVRGIGAVRYELVTAKSELLPFFSFRGPRSVATFIRMSLRVVLTIDFGRSSAKFCKFAEDLQNCHERFYKTFL